MGGVFCFEDWRNNGGSKCCSIKLWGLVEHQLLQTKLFIKFCRYPLRRNIAHEFIDSGEYSIHVTLNQAVLLNEFFELANLIVNLGFLFDEFLVRIEPASLRCEDLLTLALKPFNGLTSAFLRLIEGCRTYSSIRPARSF